MRWTSLLAGLLVCGPCAAAQPAPGTCRGPSGATEVELVGDREVEEPRMARWIRASRSAACPPHVEWAVDLDGDAHDERVRIGLDELIIESQRVAIHDVGTCPEYAVRVVDLRLGDARRELEWVCFSGDDDGRTTRFFAWVDGAIVSSPVLTARLRRLAGTGWVETVLFHCGVEHHERWVLRRGRLRRRRRWREGRFELGACAG